MDENNVQLSAPIDGLERSAILLMALEEDTAAAVMQYMSLPQVEKLSRAMAAIGPLTNERVDEVIDHFHQELELYSSINIDSSAHIKGILIKTLGPERAEQIFGEIVKIENESGFDSLNNMDAKTIAELIRDEHPQIVATIVIHLDRAQAANVLNFLPEDLRNDIVLRIATFSGVQPAALAELDQVLGGMLTGNQIRRDQVGGVKPAAEILNLMNSSNEEQVLNYVRQFDANLAQNLIDQMFLFDNLIELNGPSMQRLLQDIDNNALAIALKTASEELRQHFYSNMSNRAAEILRDDIEMRGPLRVSIVEQEQKKITHLARRLAEEGLISLNKSEDDYV